MISLILTNTKDILNTSICLIYLQIPNTLVYRDRATHATPSTFVTGANSGQH